MNLKLRAAVLAGVFAVTAGLPLSALAGKGRGPAARAGTQTQTTTQTRDCTQTRQRLRDGSCNPACPNAAGAAQKQQKKGNAYGPGDATGNTGAGPQDGTGYGAPSQR